METALFIIIIGTLTEAYMPAIKIYEIRKQRDSDLDESYYDMSFLKKTNKNNNNVKLETLVSNIILKLQNLSKRDRADDDDDDDFIDKTRSLPVLIYKKPKRDDLLQSLLGSALRSQVDVEDRTAPPRHDPLEFDY
uniref:Seminal fluid protein HACP016 n=1 Tax=Heliconius melpomene TaxID=34740 RepID=D9HQ75_HELME